MRDPSKSGSSGKNAFKLGSDLFEYVAGGLLAFFLGPQLFGFTQEAVVNYAGQKYGAPWENVFWFLWLIGCAAGTFGASVMIVATTIHIGLMKLSKKLFGG